MKASWHQLGRDSGAAVYKLAAMELFLCALLADFARFSVDKYKTFLEQGRRPYSSIATVTIVHHSITLNCRARQKLSLFTSTDSTHLAPLNVKRNHNSSVMPMGSRRTPSESSTRHSVQVDSSHNTRCHCQESPAFFLPKDCLQTLQIPLPLPKSSVSPSLLAWLPRLYRYMVGCDLTLPRMTSDARDAPLRLQHRIIKGRCTADHVYFQEISLVSSNVPIPPAVRSFPWDRSWPF